MNLNKILKYIVLIGVFLLPFIPFSVPTLMFFPFITGKGFIFRILVEVIFGVWLVLAIRDSNYWPKKSPLFIAVFSFVGIVAVADFFGQNFFKSFWSNFERMEGLITLLHLLAYFIVTTTVLNTKKIWDWFFNTSIFASIIMSFYGIMQLAGKIVINQGGARVDGTFGNSAYLAVYMLIHIFLSLFFLMRVKWSFGDDLSFLKKIYYCFAIALQVLILFYTMTRGTILGLIFGFIVTITLVLIFEKERKALRKTVAGILIGIIVLAGLFISLQNTKFIKQKAVFNRFSITALKDTAKVRSDVWKMAWSGFKEKPILGWGQENFNIVFNKYYNPSMYTQEQWFDRSHNIFLDWLIAAGIIGLLAYLSLYVFALLVIWGRRSNFSVVEKSLLTGLFVGYFIHNFFVFDNLMSYILFFSLLSFINIFTNTSHLQAQFLSSAQLKNQKKTKEIKKTEAEEMSEEAKNVFSVIAVVAMVAVLYFANFKQISANFSLIDALKPQKEGLAKNLEYFKKTFAFNTFGNSETREQLLQKIPSVVNEKEINAELKQEYVKLGREEMDKQLIKYPNDARYELFYGSLLSRIGFKNDALPHLLRAVELSPKKQQILIETGDAYLGRGEIEKALEYFKTAYESAPEYDEAMRLYGLVLIYAGKQELADKVFLWPNLTPSVLADNRVLVAYLTMKQYDKMLVIINKKIEADPNNPSLHLNLSAVYFEAGQKQKAIECLKKAIQVNGVNFEVVSNATNISIDLEAKKQAYDKFNKEAQYFISEIQAGRNPGKAK